MKTVIIGGAGYIGSHVVDVMAKAGHAITIVDNLATGYEDSVAHHTLVKGSMTQVLDDVLPGADVVIHLAALKAAGESMKDPMRYAQHNISATITLLNAMVTHAVPAIVFSSSAAVYGSPVRLPIDEQHPVNPENFYGYTKLACEQIMEWYARLGKLRVACLRYFNAAGFGLSTPYRERHPSNLLPILLEVIHGKRSHLEIFGDDYDTPDGTCIRDYVDVRDLAQAHLLAAQYLKDHDHLLVNLGSGAGASVREVVSIAESLIGRQIPVVIGKRRPGDPAHLVACSKRAEQLLGWTPQYRVKDMVQSMLEGSGQQ